MSSSESRASSLFAGRVNGGSYAAAPSSSTRRHSTHSLRRFPSLTSMTELFQSRPRARLGPALMRRKITHLFSSNLHRRSTSDTAFLSSDTAPRQRSAASAVPTPLRPDNSIGDERSALTSDIEHPAVSRRSASSSAAAGVRPYSCPAPSSPASSQLPESPPPFTMPVSNRRHRSSAGRRGKRTISKEPVATNASSSSESVARALTAVVEVSFETDVVDIVGCPSTA